MPNIVVKKGCVVIETDGDLHVLKKEYIVGYKIHDAFHVAYTSTIVIYTNIPKADICMKYEAKSDGGKTKKEFMKHAEILQSILSPEVQATGDLLAL